MSEPNQPDDDIALAGEFALHLMDADARRAFESRLAADPALRALLREWEEGLAPMTDAVPPVPPPPAVKQRLEGVLFAAAAPAGRRRWWSGWLAGGLAAGLAAVAVVIVVLTGWPGGEGPVYVAELAAEDGTTVAAARYDGGTLVVERTGVDAPPGRVLELWLLAEGETAPVSLGVLPEEASTTVSIPEEFTTRLVGGLLEISEEPPGGSPTGGPTGDVLGVGEITDL